MKRPRDDAGQVGGWEVIPFGILIFVVGSLFIVNVWAVVDARLAVGDAAREGARSYVLATNPADAERAERIAVDASLSGRGRHRRDVEVAPATLDPGFMRCATVTVRVSERVPAIVLPFIGGFGHGFNVTGTHHELIDPFRADLPEESACGD